MSSFSAWFYNKTRTDAAEEFLTTGFYSVILGGNGCYNSLECGSGFACVNNQCVFLDPQKASEDCGTGTIACASSTECGNSTPGQSCLAQDCCGDRCCRYSQGNVACNCGECPALTYGGKPCSEFCTAAYQNNINSPLPDGCGDNYCDECEYCNSRDGGTYCDLSNFGPCWCEPTRYCELCDLDGYWYSDPACWPCRPFTKCGLPTGEVYCAPGLNGSLALLKSVTQNGATRLLDEPCATCEEPPGRCQGLTYTESGNYDPSWSPPEPPEGYENEKKGYLYNAVSNETTYFVTRCEKFTTPQTCSGSCVCNKGCTGCLICDGATLTCKPDPTYCSLLGEEGLVPSL